MQDKNIKNNEHENDMATVSYFAFQGEQARSERHIVRLLIALVISIAIIFVNNMAWLYVWCQYDYSGEESTTTIELDSSGDGNANFIGNDGDINNGTGKGYENNKEADTDT